MWYEITTAEIAPRQPLDSELFTKIRNNLNICVGSLGLPNIIPNGSFEWSTGTVPLLWDITLGAGGAASLATGAHGAYALRLTRSASIGGVEAFTNDFLPAGSTSITIHGIFWTNTTAVKGGIKLNCYDASQDILAGADGTVSTNHSSYSTVPATIAMTFGYSTLTRFIKVGCFLATDSGSVYQGIMNFDGLYIQNT